MNFEIEGKLTEKFDEQQVTEKFKKAEFVIETSETSGDRTFTEAIKMQLVQDKCDLIDPYNIGDTIKVHFNIKGRRYEKDDKVSYFTNLDAWRIEKIEGETQQNNVSDIPPKTDTSVPSDDLPFIVTILLAVGTVVQFMI